MVKKKVHKDSEEYQQYLREKEKGFKNVGGGGYSGGGGNLSFNNTSANIYRPIQISTRCECINCHSNMPKNNTGKSLCDKCSTQLKKSNIIDKESKLLKYYQDDSDDKFDTIGTKEFYQLNKDRYLNDLWKEENNKLEKIDENYNKNIKTDNLNKDIDNVEMNILDKPICSKCGNTQNPNYNKGIYFCKNCTGLICGNCSKNHYKENPDHNCNHINIKDKKYWIIPEKIKCSNCNNITSIKEIYNCNICEGKPICKNCAQNHNINNPNHTLKLFGKTEEKKTEKTPKILRNKKEKDLKCPNCGTKDIISNNNMIPCPTCKIVLCDKCQNDHYTKNPSHSKNVDNIEKSDKKKLKPKLSDDKIFRRKSVDIPKCLECGKLIGNDNDMINKCNNCQTNLCDDCVDRHKINNKGHNVIKYPNPNQKSDKNELELPKNINFCTKCKVCNNSLPIQDEECIIVNCYDCEGNLCDDCCESHEKTNPQHDLNPIRAIFIENITDYNDIIPKLKCGNCRTNISDNDYIYYCDECQIDLCNNCSNNHNNEHDLILTKRILIDDNNKNKEKVKCRQCGTDLGNNDNSYKKCDKCKIDLCNACGDNHIKKYPNHNILCTLLKDNYNKNINDYNNREFENILKTPNDKCSNCNKKIYLKNNDIIIYCNDCNGNLCDNCNNNHNEDYPDHARVSPKVIILDKYLDDYSQLPIYKCIACDKKLKSDLNEPFINCDKCHGNICDDCNNSHLKEFPTHKLKLIKYIITDDNEEKKYLYENLPISFDCVSCYDKIPIEPETNYCNECKGNICKNCLKLHSKKNKNHKPKILNSFLIEKNKDNIFNAPNIICNLCEENLDYNLNEYIYNCPKCKTILCDNCITIHRQQNPDHNLSFNKYIFYDIQEEDENNDNKNKPNNLKSIQNEKCSICRKNIRIGNNNQITHCNKCKGSLCDSCEKNHSTLFPGHDFIIKKYTIIKNKNINDNNLITNDKCFKCRRNIPVVNNGNIIYCSNCPGNLCNSCGPSHTNQYIDHKIYYYNTKNIEKTNDDINVNFNNKCNECGNKINLNTVYNCNNCNKYLCDKCTNSHIKNNPEHNLIFTKIIEKTYYPVDCKICGRITRNKEGNYDINKCDKCLFNLCEPCSRTHLKKYPNHKLDKLSIPLDNENIKDNQFDNAKYPLIIENDKCCKCNQKMNLKNNDIINYCNNCNGNLCNNCSNNHYKQNPEHIVSKPNIILLKNKRDINRLPIYKCITCDKKLKTDLNKPFINCDKCHGNICDDCNNTHFKEFPTHSTLLTKYIVPDDDKYNKNLDENIPIYIDCISCKEKMPIYSDINFCNECKGNMCKNCLKLHKKNNINHKPKKLNIIIPQKENRNEKEFNIPRIICKFCGNNLDKNINDYIYKCSNCNDNICENCILKHNKEYPEHIIYFDKYIFYEIEDDDNKKNINTLKSIPTDKCYICNKNIKIENNTPVSHCNKCKGNLCDSCDNNHNLHFPGHDSIIKKYIIHPKDIEYDEYNNDIDNINLIKNDRCLICYCDIPFNNNGKIIYCNNCPGSLCNKCQREHFKKYQDHKTNEINSLIIEKDKNKNKINLCDECGNAINLNTIFNCNNCKNNLCNKCANSHIKNKPDHEIIIIKYIFENDKNNLIREKCRNCNTKIYLKNNDIINYCNHCKGILCDNCKDNHKNDYSEHITINPNSIILNKKIDNINRLPIYKCIACDKKLKTNLNEPFINCDKCHGNICDDCNNTHLKEFPTHKLKFIKYYINPDDEDKTKNDIENENTSYKEQDNKDIEKPRIKLRNKKINLKDEIDLNKLDSFDDVNNDNLPKDNINQNKKIPHDINCISCNSKIHNFKECIPCYGYLCSSCNNSNQYKNKFEIISPDKNSSFSPSNIYCIICNEYLLKDINKPINYCIICNGNICSNCSANHLNQYPKHNLILSKFILTQYIAYNENDLLNRNICFDCNTILDKNSKLVHFCHQCKGKICLDCVEKHNNKYPEHILILSKNLGSFGGFFVGEKLNCFCYICKLSHSEAQTKKYYFCKECNENICETCREKHNEKYYSHIAINPHNYEEHKNKK